MKENRRVENVNGNLKVAFWEPVIKGEVEIEPDIVVLSAAVVPNPGNKRVAEMLKVPLTKDGYFLEAHMKLRPVDFATEGVFLCGMAHSPKLHRRKHSTSLCSGSKGGDYTLEIYT
jgi:heterodisulfide reductase subunit A